MAVQGVAGFALVVLGLAVCVGAVDEGQFLLLTDIHIDPYYEVQFNSDTRCRNETYWIPDASPEELDALVPDSFFTHRPSNAEAWAELTPARDGPVLVPDFRYGQYGCDSPIALAEIAMLEAKRLVPNPDFIIFTGDMSAHGLPTWGTRTLSISDGFALMADTYPGVVVYPTLGNNDLFPDYFIRDNEVVGDNRWFENMWKIWDTTIGMPADQEDIFTGGGYYSTVAANRTMIISLNTIVLCPCREPEKDDSTDDPFGQMQWLEEQLALAASSNLQVYIIGHIPPSHGSWYTTYLHVYTGLVSKYKDIVALQLYAHNHEDQFLLMWDDSSVDPSNVPSGSYSQSPSVTPKNDNNPAFRVVSYDRDTFAPLDYWQYYMDLLLTQSNSQPTFVLEYQFTALYEQEYYNTEGVNGALEQMARNRQLYNTWKSNKHTQYEDPDDIMDDICDLREITNAGYTRCMLQGLPWLLQSEGVNAREVTAEEVLDMYNSRGSRLSRTTSIEELTTTLVAAALQELVNVAL